MVSQRAPNAITRLVWLACGGGVCASAAGVRIAVPFLHASGTSPRCWTTGLRVGGRVAVLSAPLCLTRGTRARPTPRSAHERREAALPQSLPGRELCAPTSD